MAQKNQSDINRSTSNKKSNNSRRLASSSSSGPSSARQQSRSSSRTSSRASSSTAKQNYPSKVRRSSSCTSDTRLSSSDDFYDNSTNPRRPTVDSETKSSSRYSSDQRKLQVPPRDRDKQGHSNNLSNSDEPSPGNKRGGNNKCCCLLLIALAFFLIFGGIVAAVWYFILYNENSGSGGDKPTVVTRETPTPTPLSTTATFNPTITNKPNDYQFFQCTDESIRNKDCCNGLFENNFCDLRINEILVPVVHNAIAAEDNGYPTIPTLDIRPNHYRSLEESLGAGFRGLSLDICNCDNDSNEVGATLPSNYQLCHGVCDVGDRDIIEVFTNIVDFLNNNPTETIIITIQLENGLFGELQPVDLNVLMNDYLSKVSGLSDLLYIRENFFEEWPTLRTLVESNKRLVLFHHDGPTCYGDVGECPPGLHYWFSYATETDFNLQSIQEVEDVSVSCQITRGGASNDAIGKSFLAVNGFTTPPSPDDAQDLLNTKDFILQRLNDCSNINENRIVNLYSIDYWSQGNVLEAVQIYNKNLALNQNS